MTEEEAKTQDCIGSPNCGMVADIERKVGQAWSLERQTTSGYCGLVGKP